MSFRAVIPVRTVSEANAHQHWRVRQRRAKLQRRQVWLHLFPLLRGRGKPVRVRLTRLSPRKLDSDNLAGAFKHVRDEIAGILGFDDRDDAVTWEYGQDRPAGAPGSMVEVFWE